MKQDPISCKHHFVVNHAITPPEYNGRGVGGHGLDTDHPSMRQVVLGYMLPTTPPEYNGRGG